MTIAERVENILKAVPQTRNSDKELLLIYMKKSGIKLTEQQEEIFKNIPAFETITRVRRDLQEQGKYEPTEEVKEERYQKFKNVRENIKYETPESLLEAQGYRVLPFGQ